MLAPPWPLLLSPWPLRSPAAVAPSLARRRCSASLDAPQPLPARPRRRSALERFEGLPPDLEAAALRRAAVHLGRTQSPAHRARIAEKARQRRAKAIEKQPACRLARLHPPVRARDAKRAAQTLKALPLLAPARPAPLDEAGIDNYKADLAVYRRLRRTLSGWSESFVEQHGRRPGRADVVETRIPWLVTAYEQYADVKRRLLVGAGGLRGALALSARAELPRPLGPGESF